MAERRLGKGLGSLLGGATEGEEPTRGQDPVEVRTEDVRPNSRQPRRHFDAGQLEELRDSIREHGVLQPIVVRRRAGYFELILGERRWRASQLAGRTTIPAIVRDDVEDSRMLELALVENVQRADLDPLERARAFKAMIDDLGLTQEEVASRVGLKRATVANHLRLLDLPDEIQDAVGQGLISMGHARAILGLKGQKAMQRLLERAVRDELSVRQVERLVRDSGADDKERPPKAPSRASWEVELESRLRQRLGANVAIKNGKGFRGSITIPYHSREELDRLCEVLVPREQL